MKETKKQIDEVNREVEELEQKMTAKSSNRKLLNKKSFANPLIKLESFSEEKKVEVPIDETNEQIDVKKFAIECQWLIKNAPDYEATSGCHENISLHGLTSLS